MNFIPFKNAVAEQFARMQKYELYVAQPKPVDGKTISAKDAMWDKYQSSFPAGTNEVFRERPQHDCQCCKSFIRTVGNVVAVIDGKIVSVWDVEMPDQPMYQIVANAMSKLVKRWTIARKFRHTEDHAGTDRSPEEIDGTTHYWDHFYSKIDTKFVMNEDDIGEYLSKQTAIYEVFYRGLQTIEVSAVDVVIDLLANGSLYRGDEKESNLLKFKEVLERFDKVLQKDELPFVLSEVEKLHPSIAAIRNSSMGKLLLSITDGEDLEVAVKLYEKMVAPENYKRTTAVVTPQMKKNAQKFVEENGLESALHRRHAKPTDITVNNVLFANRKAQSMIEGSVFDALETKDKKPDFSKVEEVPMEQFLTKILPQAESLELFVDNAHFGNLMSLTAPIHADSKPILQWDNNFCWSYKGEVTDSIKERVKAAGGVVDADLCARLAWWNTDDLDLYMVEPNGNQINFSNKRSPYTGGQLDVDANSPYSEKTRTPVENIFYKDKSKMKEGTYKIIVHQYQVREAGSNVGFQLDLDFMGQITHFAYEKAVRTHEAVNVVEFNYTHKNGIEIVKSIPHSQSAATEWGVTSQQWTPVNMVMLSPNHWDDNEAGNKHWFFILDKCLNPEPVRGFYNEFLRSEFREHRKVFEVLGAVTKAPFSEQQMSGLGFSSTQRNFVLCRVSGKFNRIIKINF